MRRINARECVIEKTGRLIMHATLSEIIQYPQKV